MKERQKKTWAEIVTKSIVEEGKECSHVSEGMGMSRVAAFGEAVMIPLKTDARKSSLEERD